MENKTHFESVGCIIKKEKLASYSPGYTLSELVLESQEPFPGYYNFYDFQPEPRPVLLYAAIKTEGFSEETTIRVTKQIKKQHKLTFDAAPCQISLFNDKHFAIRLDMPNMAQLPEVLKHYKERGIKFIPHREVKPYQAFITIKRYFEVEKEDNDLWHDTNYTENHYIIVPDILSWEMFEKITQHVRHNSDMITFDAALGYWYDHNGLVDFVRLYMKQAKPEVIRLLRDAYQREIERQQA